MKLGTLVLAEPSMQAGDEEEEEEQAKEQDEQAGDDRRPLDLNPALGYVFLFCKLYVFRKSQG